MNRAGALTNPLRDGVGNGGCGGAKVGNSKAVVWKFWQDDERVAKFLREGIKTTLFLAKWLSLAFLLESLMLAWLPADLVASSLGGSGLAPIGIATLVGVPAYLNGYAALPLVGGLIGQGMALVKRRVFFLYVGIALTGSFAAGLLFQLWTAI